MKLSSDEFREIQSSVLIKKSGGQTSQINKMQQALAQSVYTLAHAFGDSKALDGEEQILTRSLSNRFNPVINALAINNKKAFWHLYESNHIGQTRYRLFEFNTRSLNHKSLFRSTVQFRPSKMFVPLTPLQVEPNPTTGRRVTSRHRFVNKAMTYEYGLPVTIRPKNAKKLVFERNDMLIFTKGPVTRDSSKSQMFGSLQQAVISYFQNQGTQSVTNDVRKAAKESVRSAERGSRVNLEVNMANDAAAKAVANRVARRLK